MPEPAANPQESLKQIQLFNQIPEDQVSEKVDPGFSILRTLYDQDGPDFLTLRKLLGKADVRSQALNPSARCVLAGVISQRWDTFTLSGNLYLAGLRSANPDLRDKARKKLVCFIQPAHIPALIDLLKVPGPNVLAYEILQEVTGLHIDPSTKAWQAWWAKRRLQNRYRGPSAERYPDAAVGASRRATSSSRSVFGICPKGSKTRKRLMPSGRKGTAKISEWNNWVNSEVKRYVEDWAAAKPVLDRLVHQPDPRVNKGLESLVSDAAYGDYASVVLAWRSSARSTSIKAAPYQTRPTVGRALARGSLGDKTALVDLLRIIEKHQGRAADL